MSKPTKGAIELAQVMMDYFYDGGIETEQSRVRVAALIDDHFKPAKEALEDAHAYIHTIRMPNKIALKQRDNTNDLIEAALKCWEE